MSKKAATRYRSGAPDKTAGREVEVAPGVMDAPDIPDPPERWGLVDLVPQEDGSLRARVRPIERWELLTRARLRHLGIQVSPGTLRRLGEGGFIRIRQISPGVAEFQPDSYLEHCRRVRADPWFWTADRKRRLRSSWAGD